MIPIENQAVREKFQSYPDPMCEKLLFLRQLVLETAVEIPNIGTIEETLKWGEPSYLAKKGSTIRMDWKEKNPEQYALYFICSTTLVSTFKELYRNLFTFEGTRAIIFQEDDLIPVTELKHCLALALRYHDLKHMPLLGV